jgi:TRAP-type mannitol/chloroaromatic compound transport system permease large subunit
VDPPRNPRIEVDGAPEIAGQTEARAFRTGRDCRPRRSQIGQAPNARVACGAAGKVAVLGSILSGGVTPTEASGLGAAGATLLAAANRRLSLDVVRKVSRETMLTTAFIFGLFVGANAFALVLRSLGGDEFVGHLLTGLPFSREGLVPFILLIGFLAGFFLDWLEITLIILPLVAPVVKAAGFNLDWFVVMFAVCLQMSFLTPPVGVTLFYIKGVAPREITTRHIYRGIVPFVIIQLLAVALTFQFPKLVTWLPERMYGSSR